MADDAKLPDDLQAALDAAVRLVDVLRTISSCGQPDVALNHAMLPPDWRRLGEVELATVLREAIKAAEAVRDELRRTAIGVVRCGSVEDTSYEVALIWGRRFHELIHLNFGASEEGSGSESWQRYLVSIGRPNYDEERAKLLADVKPDNAKSDAAYRAYMESRVVRSLEERVASVAQAWQFDPDDWGRLEARLRLDAERAAYARLRLDVESTADARAAGKEEEEEPPDDQSSDEVMMRVVSLYSKGVSDERLTTVKDVLNDEKLNSNEKLFKVDKLMPIPATASGADLAKLLGVTKPAVLKTEWWGLYRKGEKQNEIGRRREGHKKRAKEHEPDARQGDDE